METGAQASRGLDSDGLTEARFLDGLASASQVDRHRLGGPGTTVVGRADRAGSGALACYRTHRHLLVWGDPAVVGRVTTLQADVALGPDELDGCLSAVGFSLRTAVRSNVLDGAPVAPRSLPEGYRHRWLDEDDPATRPTVAAFVASCEPDDVEAAGLDDLEAFDETAINVVTVPSDVEGDGSPVVAYASAAPWDWDPAFADIGVLVHGGHRFRGLARTVVAHTVARLHSAGRLPLYRHELTNPGSAATAAAVGFRPVATLWYFVSDS